jgi:hypothetical protein
VHEADGQEPYDGHDDQKPGLDHSIRPGVPCPETVLVARMTDGSYLLMAYPQRVPAAFVVKTEADLLRQVLDGAFGSPPDDATSGNGTDTSNGTVRQS